MLPPRARETTNLARVVAGVVFAFAFPPVGLALSSSLVEPPASLAQGTAVLAALPAMLTMSLFVGWIFVAPACIAWACLHQVERHHAWAASLVGLATGLAFGSLLAAFGDDLRAPPLYGVCATTGLLTAMGVWRIAYGWDKRSPSPGQASAS